MWSMCARWLCIAALIVGAAACLVDALVAQEAAGQAGEPDPGMSERIPGDSAPAPEEQLFGPRTFNSELPLEVWAVKIDWDTMEVNKFEIGRTPAPEPLLIPECTWWGVRSAWEPSGEAVAREVRRKCRCLGTCTHVEPDWEAVALEVSRHDIPGLTMVGATDAALEHLRELVNLQWLALEMTLASAMTRVSDAGLEHLRGLVNLERLNLSLTQVSDAGLEHLRGLANLRELYLHKTQVSDAGLQHLRGLVNLRELGLSETQVSDAGLEHLRGLVNLRVLSLGGTQVSVAGVEELKRHLPELTVWPVTLNSELSLQLRAPNIDGDKSEVDEFEIGRTLSR